MMMEERKRIDDETIMTQNSNECGDEKSKIALMLRTPGS